MALDSLLNPMSIAVVGASDRISIGRTIVESLGALGFGGAIHPVHPGRAEVLGHACHRNLAAIGSPVDLAAICLGQERVLTAVEEAAGIGVGALVIFAGGFAEAGEDGARQQARIVEICRENGIVLCGPNCMGAMSLANRSHAYMMDVLDRERLTGKVGFVSQSGSISIGMLTDTRRYGFSHVVSTGNEAVTTSAMFVEHMIDDPATGIIALFTETIRDPERFVAALDRAADAGKPVVVLKAGQSARAQTAIATHTGGMAGEARVFSAMLRAHRAIEVESMEEMTEVLAVLHGRNLPRGKRLSVVTGSGGHAGLLLDMAERAGFDFPPLRPEIRQRIESGIGPLTGDGNPADSWGQGDFAANFSVTLNQLFTCGDYDAVGVLLDANDGQAVDYLGQDEIVRGMMERNFEGRDLPFYLMSSRHGVMKTHQVEEMTKLGIAMLSGLTQGLSAVCKVADWVNGRTFGSNAETAHGEAPSWSGRASVHEIDAKRLLASAGLPASPERIATDVDDAVVAAGEIGYPAVMKAVGDAIPHRSEHGLIELRLGDADAVRAAWGRLTEKLGAMDAAAGETAIAVQAMAGPGVEVIAGIARDPAFGLVLAVGPGGVLAELFDEVKMCCLPPAPGDFEALIEGGRLATLLDGFRGAPPADRAALITALRALSDFAVAHAPWIEGIDINPLIVHTEGCTSVDALIVPRRQSGFTRSD
ncbi:MAG: acetate--CoA ligase family protein [Rhodospirillales bacterium]|nr:acetate--CoA ligase family protein [Rhodospirillales bacterium]